MDEARVLARLDRIDELDRSGAAPAEFWRSCWRSCGGCSARPRRLTREQRRGEERNGGGGRAPTHGAGTGHNRHVIAHWDEAESEPRRKPATSPASGPTSAGRRGRRRSALKPDQGRSGEVVDALPPADRGGGDLLRPRRLGHLPAPGLGIRGRPRRLHRPSRARAPHPARGRRGARRARVRDPRPDRGCTPPARGRVLARRLVGRGRRRRPSLGA